MDEEIHDEELLYRGVRRSRPDLFLNGMPTPALFIDPKGASFSRDGDREEYEITKSLAKKIKTNHKPDYMGCVKLSAGECRDAGAYPIPKPSSDDEYHAEVHESDSIVQISLQKAMIMCDLCRIVELEDIEEEKNEQEGKRYEL